MNLVKPDLSRIAKKVVNECLMVRPGENFWISCADPYYLDFAEEVAAAAIEAGAYPLITVSSDRLSRKFFNNNEEYLKRQPVFSPSLIKAADVHLNIGFSKDPLNIKNVPPEKLAASSTASSVVWETMMDRNKDGVKYRNSSFFYPTPEAAEKSGMDFDEYAGMIWDSINIDYKKLSERAKKIESLLNGSQNVRITSDDGTDLEFSIKGRKAVIDDGILDEHDLEINNGMQNLPTGEVFTTPLENSANGTAVFQFNIFMGKPLVNLRVKFKDGVIVDMEADEGLEHYKKVMDGNTGDKYTIAELGIGLNPAITKIVGDLALDEKIIGTIHIATGENRFLGGINKSSIHWDLVMQKPTLALDGEVIMKNGEYLV